MKKIRILLVDIHPIFREGLCKLLQEQRDMECVAIASGANQAVELTKELLPDGILIDPAIPGTVGIELSRDVKMACPGADVIILTHHKSDRSVLYYCIRNWVSAYLFKDISTSDLMSVIRLVHAGKVVFDVRVTSNILQSSATSMMKTC